MFGPTDYSARDMEQRAQEISDLYDRHDVIENEIIEDVYHYLGRDAVEISTKGECLIITPKENNPHGLALEIEIFARNGETYPHFISAEHGGCFTEEGDLVNDLYQYDAIELLVHLVKNNRPLVPTPEYLAGEFMSICQ